MSAGRRPDPCSRPVVVLSDADGLAENRSPALVVLQISRKEIETCNIASAVERLHVLTDSAENVLLYRESLLFQVSGFDSDPRELPQIPEVRAYFARLSDEWPHWLWFLVRGFGSIALLLSLLCRVQLIRRPDGGFGSAFESEHEVRDVLLRLFARGNALFDTYEIEDSLVEESANSVTSEIFEGE